MSNSNGNNGYGICPKCLAVRKLTKHHIYPIRYYGNGGRIFRICKDCHNHLEIIIHRREAKIKRSREFYKKILDEFLVSLPVLQ